ncbi:MAG: nitroreductase family protein [Pseudomonadota bacterium]|nr:nitroreductase family protein [Pseudomonadota bacterium]
MKPRKPVFGLAYIEETVLAFEICMENQGERPLSQELLWARDVLQEFFSKVDSQGNPLLRQCKDRYESALKGVQDHCQPSTAQQATRKIPYRRDLSSRPVTPDAFRALCIKRRSVRWFLDKPVPRQRVDEAILSGTLSPSACNRQPFSFRIFDDPEKVQAVASIPMGTKGFCQNFSMIAVVVGELSAYSHERDRHVIYVDAALATMGFTLALETEGLSSCVINWPDIEEKEQAMQRALSLRTDERVIMLVAIGWPDPEECVPYSQKKELECIRSYN